ncbi:hypothetical protein [Zooshikella sp. RANM57]|uniref:hypothetical protein n=1 Tax=Zooshikella sp. RANM57 TaxID=3425863 RepID=UPI003D701867
MQKLALWANGNDLLIISSIAEDVECLNEVEHPSYHLFNGANVTYFKNPDQFNDISRLIDEREPLYFLKSSAGFEKEMEKVSRCITLKPTYAPDDYVQLDKLVAEYQQVISNTLLIFKLHSL